MSGSFLPTTVAAKSSGPPLLVPDPRLLSAIAGILLASQPWMTLLALGGVVESVRRLGGPPRPRSAARALEPRAAARLGDALVGQRARGRELRALLLPAAALRGAARRARSRAAAVRPPALGRALAAGARSGRRAAAPAARDAGALLARQRAKRYLVSCTNVRESNVALARWLGPRLPPDALVAVNDVGAFKYLLPNRLLDLVGLMTPEVTRRRRWRAPRGAAAAKCWSGCSRSAGPTS